MNRFTEPNDSDAATLSKALREQEQGIETPDVRDALSKRLRQESRDGGVGYVAVQALLLASLLAAGIWYALS